MEHEYDGSCAPDKSSISYNCRTFSVGIYEILPKARGKGTKRGPVKVRVKGVSSSPETVYSKAKQIVRLLDEGQYFGPKTVTVK